MYFLKELDDFKTVKSGVFDVFNYISTLCWLTQRIPSRFTQGTIFALVGDLSLCPHECLIIMIIMTFLGAVSVERR